MRRISRISTAVAVHAYVLFFAVPAMAEIHYVAPSGLNVPPFIDVSTAATNMQDAIDVASNGDSVLVMGGTYRLTQ